MRNYILPLIAVLLSGISFVLLVRDREKHPTREGEEQLVNTVYTKPMIFYCVLMLLVTVVISVVRGMNCEEYAFFHNAKIIVLLAVIWPIAYIDLKTYRIPNAFIVFGLCSRALILPFELLFGDTTLMYTLLSEVIASVALFLAGLLCAVCMKGSIGFGDIKLFIVIGLLLGMEGTWSAIFTSLLVSFVIAVYLLVSKKKTRKDAIPFGPAIVVGTYISICLSGM